MPFVYRFSICSVLLLGGTLLLNGCEGTGATPSFFPVKPVNSKISGQVMADMACIHSNPESGKCSSYGTALEVQFQMLHEPAVYVAVIQHGRCSKPGAVISRVPLRTVEDEPSEGILGDALVDEPIHTFLTAGNSAALYDRNLKRVVACGDLLTDRVF